jgi:hypothetical protein
MRARWIIGVTVLVVIAALAALVLLRWTPQVPADAAAAPLTRAVMTGEVAPDPSEGTDPSQVAISPAGGACLPRIERADGWFDVCWEAHRNMSDADPAKDYYVLRVYGTVGPGESGSPQWAVLKGDLVGAPADQTMEGWPKGTYDGACGPQVIGTMFLSPIEETVCGHTIGFDTGIWAHEVDWTCVGCLLPDERNRSLSLYIAVGVPEGTVPEWDVYADVGG